MGGLSRSDLLCLSPVVQTQAAWRGSSLIIYHAETILRSHHNRIREAVGSHGPAQNHSSPRYRSSIGMGIGKWGPRCAGATRVLSSPSAGLAQKSF